jgi:hypothetical protein
MDIPIDTGKTPTTIRVQKELTSKERQVIGGVLNGNTNPNSQKTQEILQRPHVAIAFEAILDKHNLSDEKLIKRLADIVVRKATTSTSDKGAITTNITAIDANAKDTIRMIWQVQGKFVEKHEIKGELHNYDDKDLDSLIASGLNFLQNKGKTRLNESATDRADSSSSN